ncbi:MAG: hypothetical protein ACFFD3_03420 [Candidatus Thorarchaeota archaeon]
MDSLLVHAKGLYRDRQRIALATVMIVFTVTFYIFYSPGIYTISEDVPSYFDSGWAQGIEIVYSFNTVGFFLAFAIMVFAYALWIWAFLPAPAVSYTLGVLRGVFGSKVKVRPIFGKRFRLLLENGVELSIICRIRSNDPQNWFIYRLESSPIDSPNIRNIALRHGMSVYHNRFVTWVDNEELHSRSILMAKAINMASS